MEELIKNMIRYAEEKEDHTIIDFVDELLYIFEDVINTPSEWANIRAELVAECKPDSWAFKFLGLQDYINY